MTRLRIAENRFRFILILSALLTTSTGILLSQDIDLDVAVTHDDNVFDTYAPIYDRIVQFQADCSQYWDFDRASIEADYNGAALIFRELPGRNYHQHFLSLTGLYRIENPDSEEEEESDSTGEESRAETDSARASSPVQADTPDSLCHFLEIRILGSGQFDREVYSIYDNLKFSGSAAFRQPLGERVSIRPVYILSYHTYTNLAGLSNLQNTFGFHLGTDILPGGWFSVTPYFAVKSYPEASQFFLTYLVDSTIVEQTHGKPVITKRQVGRQKKVDLNSPSVRQGSFTVYWKQRLSPVTSFGSVYTYYGRPSSAARVIPELGHGAVTVSEGPAGQNDEIFDDHFSYSGSEYQLQVNQLLPVSFQLGVIGEYSDKEYTYNATNEADSVLSENRHDKRTSFGITLSRGFAFGKGRILTPRIEFHHTGNVSNAAYYVFTKNGIVAGIEFTF